MAILKNFFKKNDEIKNDYEINDIKKEDNRGRNFTQEDLDSSARTRRKKAMLKQLEMDLELRRTQRQMDRDEFDYQLEQEERLERLKALKMENMSNSEGGSTEDAMFMQLLSLIGNKQNAPMPQSTPDVQNMANIQHEAEEWKPNTRFTDEQMKEMISKLPPQVIQAFKNLEEDEVLQAYDLIKVM